MANDRALTQEELKAACGVVIQYGRTRLSLEPPTKPTGRPTELLDHCYSLAVQIQAALTRMTAERDAALIDNPARRELAKVKAERDRLREEVERLKCPACIEVIESRNRSEAERDRLRNQLESHKAVLNKMPKALNAASEDADNLHAENIKLKADVQQVLAESGHRAGSSTRLRPKWRRAEDDEDQEAKRIDILEAENATLREQVEAWKAWQRRLIWKGPIGGGVLSELYDCIQTGPQPLGNQPTKENKK